VAAIQPNSPERGSRPGARKLDQPEACQRTNFNPKQYGSGQEDREGAHLGHSVWLWLPPSLQARQVQMYWFPQVRHMCGCSTVIRSDSDIDAFLGA